MQMTLRSQAKVLRVHLKLVCSQSVLTCQLGIATPHKQARTCAVSLQEGHRDPQLPNLARHADPRVPDCVSRGGTLIMLEQHDYTGAPPPCSAVLHSADGITSPKQPFEGECNCPHRIRSEAVLRLILARTLSIRVPSQQVGKACFHTFNV